MTDTDWISQLIASTKWCDSMVEIKQQNGVTIIRGLFENPNNMLTQLTGTCLSDSWAIIPPGSPVKFMNMMIVLENSRVKNVAETKALIEKFGAESLYDCVCVQWESQRPRTAAPVHVLNPTNAGYVQIFKGNDLPLLLTLS